MSSFKPPDPDNKDKPRPDFSRVRSGAASTAQVKSEESMRSGPAQTPVPAAAVPPAATPVPTPPTGERSYVVKPGDSLSKIARREYGDARKWPAIFEANKDTIKNPDLIFPGQKLIIPELKK